MGNFYFIYTQRCDCFLLLFCQSHVLHADCSWCHADFRNQPWSFASAVPVYDCCIFHKFYYGNITYDYLQILPKNYCGSLKNMEKSVAWVVMNSPWSSPATTAMKNSSVSWSESFAMWTITYPLVITRFRFLPPSVMRRHPPVPAITPKSSRLQIIWCTRISRSTRKNTTHQEVNRLE